MKKELKKLIDQAADVAGFGAFNRTGLLMREAEALRQEQVRELFRMWADLGGYSLRAQLTSWQIEGEGKQAELHFSFYHWKRRGQGRIAAKGMVQAYLLDLPDHARVERIIDLHETAARTAEQDWAEDRETRLAALRRDLARVEAEVFTNETENLISAAELQSETETQLLDPARLFIRHGYPGGARRPSTGLVLATSIRERKRRSVELVIRHRSIPVRISVPEAFKLADRHFTAAGVTDRESYLARAAELKRELRETHAAVADLKAAIRARLAGGDSAYTEMRALEELRDRHAAAHDERVLMKAWAGLRIRRMREAEKRAAEKATAAAA